MPAPLAFILFILVCQIVYALYSGLPLPQAKERQFYAHEDEDDQTETETLEVDHEVAEPILLIEPALEELPTNRLAIAILKSTLTPEQVAQIRVVRQPGALPGEILDELPVGQFELEFERSMSHVDDTVDVTLHD